MVDQAATRGAYQVWPEFQTFAAAVSRCWPPPRRRAGLHAGQGVVRHGGARPAAPARSRSQANADARTRLYDLRRAVVALSGEINAYGQASTWSA